ncbi:hypothetical protein OG361_37790 [Streptomyces sp. NBC_00090]|uniref:hypothetical protein n=1 Tax=Streptomyces sp. NBC_00090 TaxID=2903619 RepID=UPI003243EC58
MDPVFQMFPEEQPLRLVSRATSGLIPFLVPADATAMFLRLVAVGSGCEPLGGAAPTIELRAGTGEIATVPRAPSEGAVHDESGNEVGTASWTRERDDIFMVKLLISEKNARLWRVRITNNDPEELGFVWVTSDVEEDTHQPRISMNRSLGRHAVAGAPLENIVASIANVGTTALKFDDLPGTDMGAGFTLVRVASSIPPNGCGSIEIKVAPIVAGTPRAETQYKMKCNVVDVEDRTLFLVRSQKTTKETVKEKDGDKGTGEKGKDGQLDVKAGDTLTGRFQRMPEGAGGGVGERLAGLERTVSELVHFISPELRPDLSTSALDRENRAGQEAKYTKESKDAKDGKDVEKQSDR